MEVTTEHQKWPKIITNGVNKKKMSEGQKKPRSKAEALEVSPRSRLYLLLLIKVDKSSEGG